MDSAWVATPGEKAASVSQAARSGWWHLQEGTLAVITGGWGVIHLNFIFLYKFVFL